MNGVETSNVYVILDGFGECKIIIGNMSAHGYITPNHVSTNFSSSFLVNSVDIQRERKRERST